MHDAVEKILFTEEQIKQKVHELGAQITADCRGQTPLLVGVLRGSVVFMADLMREIDLPCHIDFMAVSSYGASTTSTGVVRILKDLDDTLTGRDLIIIEDILDTGNTLAFLKRMLINKGAHSVRIVTLLDKPERRRADIKADYVGFTIPDEFVVGYGLDYAQDYRNLPYIGVLKPEVYKKR